MSHMRVILFVSAVLLILCGCRKQSPEMTRPEQNSSQPTVVTVPEIDRPDPEAQLLCSADSLEAARQIAELYGIVLVDYSDGYACFFTEEDPKAVILRGKTQGWPELSLNRMGLLS